MPNGSAINLFLFQKAKISVLDTHKQFVVVLDSNAIVYFTVTQYLMEMPWTTDKEESLELEVQILLLA
jgi:hypothetical protein